MPESGTSGSVGASGGQPPGATRPHLHTLPPTRLFEAGDAGRFFGGKRFDREGNRRFHVHTFGNLLQADFRILSMDYLDLMKVTRILTRNHLDTVRAFRRLVFNVLAHNRDDHVKNVSFLLDSATGI